MDLSEDEDLRKEHYILTENSEGLYPSPANAEHRRLSFNNNKVLVGGDNGKTTNEQNNQFIHRREVEEPKFNVPPPKLYTNQEDFDVFDEDLRHSGAEINMERRNPSPPEYSEWPQPRPLLNQRFPRNWTPRTNFRPFTPQFWPRNGPRPNRWPGPRPQRFW
ncbi:PREDICTED: uncharacterized protein LOC106103222 [Papilio polytes]|uniref:uncharacterized protein LOC106103222 n=1 Tax=Papilio polytes TaxID=76194 RepID=UPI000675E8C3|nr:PREDICTED: uncharacterized protein LOC106103222 [Papilio polytes]